MIAEIRRFFRGMSNYLKHCRSLETEYPFAKLFKKFQDILSANNASLELIADMGDKLSGEYVFDRQYILSTYDRLKNQIYRLIFDLNTLAPGKYVRLFDVFEDIHDSIQQAISGKWAIPQGDAVMSYTDLSQDMVDLVGGKNANIADIRNILELPTPDGFAITTSAFRAFLEKNGLDEHLQQAMVSWDPDDEISTEKIADNIQNLFLKGGFPVEVMAQIQSAIGRIKEKHPREPLFFAVRSSAWGEDSAHSFAGQYKSFLNVPAEQLPITYRKVLAGAYSSGALSYLHQKGFHIHESAMSVGCQLMINA